MQRRYRAIANILNNSRGLRVDKAKEILPSY